MESKTYTFGPGETIISVIGKFNHIDLSKEQLRSLMSEFNRLNGRVVPRTGETFKIPIYNFEQELEIPKFPNVVNSLKFIAKKIAQEPNMTFEEKRSMLDRHKRRQIARMKITGIELPKEIIEIEIKRENVPVDKKTKSLKNVKSNPPKHHISTRKTEDNETKNRNRRKNFSKKET